LPPVATTFVGAAGTVAGVTELLTPETEPVPIAFVAVTVNVYAVPLFKPVTVMGLPVEVAEILFGFEVTV
jgi:hypothetical protein